MSNNIIRARVTIRGTRRLIQHAFTEDSIPLEKEEKAGVAGNNPEEWRKTMMVTEDGQLYIKDANVFACICQGAKFSKRGRSSLLSLVAATLQVEEEVILLNRHMPLKGDPPRDPKAPVHIYVCPVVNPSTKGRNIRYRLAAAPGWECSFTILWDKTVVSRPEMRTILKNASILAGICDGRGRGAGRFTVISFEELADAEETTAEGDMGSPPGDSLEEGQEEVCALQDAGLFNGVSH